MSAQLLDDVKQFLQALEATQKELIDLFGRKRAALRQPQAAELLRLSESEVELTKRIQILLGRRQSILQQAGHSGLPDDSILNLAIAIGGNERGRLEPRIQRARQIAGEIGRENRMHWIVAQSAYNHYNELLELIAHCGRKAPTYSAGAEPDRKTGGGAILDASA